MDRPTFAARLHAAAAAARDFARKFVCESLPDPLRFRVRLNSSYDGNPLVGDEVVYPDDGGFDRAFALHDIDADTVVDTLWRDGRVPEWINLSVIGERGAATLIEVLACGRYSALPEYLYHETEGYPPFHVLSPTLPPDHEDGGRDRFSVHRHAECWTADELAHVAAHADRVESLTLIGPACTDERLAALPEFPRLARLDLRESTLTGPGLAGLARLPRLRSLQVGRAAAERLDLVHLPPAPHLEVLELDILAAALTGVDRLAALTGLTDLTVRATGPLLLDAPLPALPRLCRFTLEAPALPPNLRLRADELEQVTLRVGGVGDGEVQDLLAGHHAIMILELRGTAITDAFLDELPRWPALRFLDVVDTRVTTPALRRLAQRRPDLKFRPTPR